MTANPHSLLEGAFPVLPATEHNAAVRVLPAMGIHILQDHSFDKTVIVKMHENQYLVCEVRREKNDKGDVFKTITRFTKSSRKRRIKIDWEPIMNNPTSPNMRVAFVCPYPNSKDHHLPKNVVHVHTDPSSYQVSNTWHKLRRSKGMFIDKLGYDLDLHYKDDDGNFTFLETIVTINEPVMYESLQYSPSNQPPLMCVSRDIAWSQFIKYKRLCIVAAVGKKTHVLQEFDCPEEDPLSCLLLLKIMVLSIDQFPTIQSAYYRRQAIATDCVLYKRVKGDNDIVFRRTNGQLWCEYGMDVVLPRIPVSLVQECSCMRYGTTTPYYKKCMWTKTLEEISQCPSNLYVVFDTETHPVEECIQPLFPKYSKLDPKKPYESILIKRRFTALSSIHVGRLVKGTNRILQVIFKTNVDRPTACSVECNYSYQEGVRLRVLVYGSYTTCEEIVVNDSTVDLGESIPLSNYLAPHGETSKWVTNDLLTGKEFENVLRDIKETSLF